MLWLRLWYGSLHTFTPFRGTVIWVSYQYVVVASNLDHGSYETHEASSMVRHTRILAHKGDAFWTPRPEGGEL